jgi:hypothetical protein
MVDDRFSFNLDELDTPEMGCVEGASAQLE